MRVSALNDLEYWTLSPLRCAACGDTVRHYLAGWDSQNAPDIFAIPYAGLNGGIGREIVAPDGFPDHSEINECKVYLSRCCDTPYMGTGRTYQLVFHSVSYRCRALDLDDAIRCRLNRHIDGVHLGPHETPYQRKTDRTWTMYVIGEAR